jgi:hypothetical protein
VGGEGWNPWRVLWSRPHLELRWALLTPGSGRIEELAGGRRRITLDARLGRRARSATLGHELVHDELDLLSPPGVPDAVVARTEQLVERINAERTLPPGALRAYVDRVLGLEEAVTAAMVADEFDTTEQLAKLALHLLLERGVQA